MSLLNLRDPGTRAALRHPALAGLKRIARGSFCAVYDKGMTVLKLTRDPVSYEFAAGNMRPEGLHFPRLIETWRDVGETSDGDPLYLFEVEKLQPVRRGAPYHVKKAVKMLTDRMSATYHEHLYGPVDADEVQATTHALLDLSQSNSLAPDLRADLESAGMFAGNFEGILDCHASNIMLRDDVVVLNDIMVGAQALNALRAKQQRARF